MPLLLHHGEAEAHALDSTFPDGVADWLNQPVVAQPPVAPVIPAIPSIEEVPAPVSQAISHEVATPLNPLDNSVNSREMLMAKARAFRESQDIKSKHAQPEQLSMNMEEASLEEARRMARDVLSSSFAGQNLDVPAFIRKRQNLELDK